MIPSTSLQQILAASLLGLTFGAAVPDDDPPSDEPTDPRCRCFLSVDFEPAELHPNSPFSADGIGITLANSDPGACIISTATCNNYAYWCLFDAVVSIPHFEPGEMCKPIVELCVEIDDDESCSVVTSWPPWEDGWSDNGGTEVTIPDNDPLCGQSVEAEASLVCTTNTVPEIVRWRETVGTFTVQCRNCVASQTGSGSGQAD